MLFPIDVIVAVIYRTLISENSKPDISISPAEIIFSTFLLLVITLAVIETAARLLAASIRRKGLVSAKVRVIINYTELFFRAVLVFVYIIMLEEISWPGVLLYKTGLEGSAFFSSVISLFPYLLMFSLSRMSFHRLENIISPGKWKVVEYMFFKARTTLYIIVPWLCIWLLTDIVNYSIGIAEKMQLVSPGRIEQFFNSIPVLGLFIPFLVLAPVIVLFPAILVKIWKCKKLPKGSLKEKLANLQDKAEVRFDRIYIWQLGGKGFLNGAVIGFIRPFRFLLLSEGLLENLTEEEVCGVVGHELGHVKHRHLLWYLFFTTAFISTAAALLERQIFDIHLLTITVCVLIAVYLRIVFGFISRRFERQADLFGLEIMGRAEPLASSLEKIGFLSGGVRSVKSWHHLSIAERVDFLSKAENNPLVRLDHHAHCRRVKLAGAVLACASLIIFISVQGGAGVNATGRLRAYKPAVYFKHWQKAAFYFPEDFECRINLAESAFALLQQKGEVEISQIQTWLQEAESLAESKSEYERVEKLREKLNNG